MKAQNGNPTNLTPRQWVQVRTKAFKKWFGDWEKRSRIEKLRKSKSVSITGEEYGNSYTDRESAKEWAKSHIKGKYKNADTGEMIAVSNVGIKEVTSHGTTDDAHMQSIAAIPEMIKRAVFIEERENRKNNGKFDSYRYYVVGLKIGGVDYTAKLVVGVKNGSRFYDHRLSKIEKGTLIDSLNGLSNTVAENQSSSASDGKGMTLNGLLQTNCSKVVDENGEPMVVYRGASFDPFPEEAGKGVIKQP